MQKLKRDKIFLLLLLPTILYYVIFKYMPMFGIVISFKQYEVFKGIWESDWVGLKHYITFFQSPSAWNLIRNTFLIGFYSLIFGFPAPIILALLLNELRQNGLKRVFQSLSYLPHFISIVVVTSMATMFLSPTNGIVNELLGFLGIDPIPFMQKASWFRTIYVSTGIWQEVGWGSIIYLAALTTIDPQLYDAAEMDGASRGKKMWHITIPGIMPAIVILLILRVGNIIDIGFEKVYLLYNPATYETADILSTYVYRTGLVAGNFSYGAAIDVFSGVIGLIFVVTVNHIARKVGENSLW
ncbi:sugar ABC transporter permease [Paenibacillus sp. IB182496]|uniref:Sugar ABC transporter permease n=1 Tax=Paenibacillus sabuli TaxID=2772509 RepID=A0A927GQE9_9BACL|nr:ABC transporter permease subunit [Paenibacillus sabuli]MBD2844308.1 sugar ABC transporter permease [Paenibacillus sabuli]